MSGKRLPNCRLKLSKPSAADGYEMGAYRDKIGNVTIGLWKAGVGFRDMTEIHYRDVEKLRDWLTKVIDYVGRK